MGTNTSKISDILYVTGASLDPPGLHDSKQYTPQKEMKIDYTKFIPKSYYKQDASDKQIEQHLQKVNKKEKILKLFKHHKDFDRVDYKRMADQVVTFQIFMEELIKYSFVTSLLFARISTVQLFSDYHSNAATLRLIFPVFLSLIPVILWRSANSQEYHIVNHQYFRIVPDKVALYTQYDQKFNLYKDVQDMKYNYKYHSVREYYKTRRYVHDSSQAVQKGLYRQCFLYDYGLKVDPLEEFAKKRQKSRVGNWQILTEEERKVIQKQLQSRNEEKSQKQ